MEPDPMAQKRADLIMQVRSGKLTAVDAAQQLGISRKTYYKWETRALEALLEAMSDRGAGGRPTPDRDTEKDGLRERVAELEDQLREWEQAEQVREAFAAIKKRKPTNGLGP